MLHERLRFRTTADVRQELERQRILELCDADHCHEKQPCRHALIRECRRAVVQDFYRWSESLGGEHCRHALDDPDFTGRSLPDPVARLPSMPIEMRYNNTRPSLIQLPSVDMDDNEALVAPNSTTTATAATPPCFLWETWSVRGSFFCITFRHLRARVKVGINIDGWQTENPKEVEAIVDRHRSFEVDSFMPFFTLSDTSEDSPVDQRKTHRWIAQDGYDCWQGCPFPLTADTLGEIYLLLAVLNRWVRHTAVIGNGEVTPCERWYRRPPPEYPVPVWFFLRNATEGFRVDRNIWPGTMLRDKYLEECLRPTMYPPPGMHPIVSTYRLADPPLEEEDVPMAL